MRHKLARGGRSPPPPAGLIGTSQCSWIISVTPVSPRWKSVDQHFRMPRASCGNGEQRRNSSSHSAVNREILPGRVTREYLKAQVGLYSALPKPRIG